MRSTESAQSIENPLQQSSAVEQVSPTEVTRRQEMFRAWARAQRERLVIVATTETRHGQKLDWIPIESQVPDGKLEAPPVNEHPVDKELPQRKQATPPSGVRALANVDLAPTELGPRGTVPVVQFDVEGYLAAVGIPPESIEKFEKSRRPAPDAINRYYTLSYGDTITNYGTRGFINAWNAPQGAPANEMSINQSSTYRGSPLQTVEVGTIEGNGFGTAPKLFVYYTTNGYASVGNNVGGYNSSVSGWVQVSTTKVPGVMLSSPLSTPGGAQYEMEIRTRKNGTGGWWVMVNGEWIGYYPKTLFSTAGLRDEASAYQWYREIYDANAPAATSTDLGSGALPGAGFGQAAYFRNIARYRDTSGSSIYDSSGSGGETDPACYATNPPSTSTDPNWQNWTYFGGPGDEGAGCN